ncbi:MAG: DUF1559 domain-containing protein [Planctomycetes bacterium]|nr:DUF1559 domain-containing protein [Planctomycetota bacterium]
MGQATRRGAFTLVELLVVIFLIGLVIALFLPAKRVARESARRASCSVKLKNLAIALHTYHDNFQKFPPSAFYPDRHHLNDRNVLLMDVVPGQNGNGHKQAPYSFHVALLPYFEQGHLYEQIDFAHHEAFAPANYPLAAKMIPVLNCPSYRGPANSTAKDYAPPAGGAKPALTNYKALGATTLACLQDSKSVTSDQLNGGLLHPYASYRLKDMPAPSQTAILAETKEEKYSAWWDGTTASMPGFHPGSGNVQDDRLPTPPAGVPALNLSAQGAQTNFMTTAQFGGQEDMQWGPSSEHPGLVNHANGGTESRSINNDIDPVVYRALISRRADDNADIGDLFK